MERKKTNSEKILSVVAPAYNEVDGLDEFYSRLVEAVKDLELQLEIIYVNDGSKDGTLEVMSKQHNSDSRITIIDLSRNFGKEVALTAGLDHATGDAIVVIDTDLQDPPELIPELVRKWTEGFDVVNAKRIKRKGETAFKKITSFVYYRFLYQLSDIKIPKDTGDFRLLSRKALNALLTLREKHRYMKGLFAWVGYSQAEITYERDERYAGETKWNFLGLLDLAFEGLTSFSVLPLRLASLLGFLSAFAGLFFAIIIILKKIMFGDPVAGYPSLVVLITFIGGVQLLALGIIGEYLGRVFNETKNRPLYFVKDIKPSDYLADNKD
ncbi:MAG: glycosyltransferase family 2 protein [Proteobacteria bacterium]|nr:glycosyltransferase [Pseudomonadota bacterium]NOG60129.1 glycosyltransferase family 2 protein [Pseudomonadota bacterium]